MKVKNLDFVDNHHQILGLRHADHLQLETEDHNETDDHYKTDHRYQMKMIAQMKHFIAHDSQFNLVEWNDLDTDPSVQN